MAKTKENNRTDLVVSKAENGMRIDLFIAQRSGEISKTQVRKILDHGALSINGRRERFANRTLQPGDKVTYFIDSGVLTSKKKMDFGDAASQILREDGSLIIVNKPAGMPSQPTKDAKLQDASKFFGRGKTIWPCHRLDKETSGILVLAKSRAVSQSVMDLFRTREVRKEYLAIVTGKPTRDEWTEKCYLSEILEKKGRVEVVRAGGRISETRFEVLGHSKGLSLLRCFPKTGRTHQIRVHLEKANVPIFGDKIYGLGMAQDPVGMESLAVKRHFLHASLLSFQWDEANLEVTAEIPSDFRQVLDKSGLTKYLI